MPTMRQKVGDWISGRKSGGANWFIDFMKIAADEDSASGGITQTNAYRAVAWINIAVSTRARNLARAPLRLYQGDGDTPVESGPVYDLFAREGTQLWEATEGWRCLRGEAFWILGWGGAVGLPKKIVIVDPLSMSAKLSPDGQEVTMWVYTNGGVKIPFKPEEVIHLPMWNPYDSVRGMSELTPLMDELNQEYLMSRGTARLLENQSIPGGIITIPGDEMSEEQANRTIERWEKKHKGINRSGRVAVLGSGATYQKISLSPQEMQSLEARGWNRDTILAKFGVPHAVVGLKSEVGSLAGKDTAEQMKSFWNLTLIPELEFFQKKLEEEFFTRYKVGMNAEFDTTELWEMQADEELLSNRLRMDVNAGILTQNEARELKGMDPVDWGDTWWKPLGLTDVTEGPYPQSYMAPPSRIVEANNAGEATAENPDGADEKPEDEEPPKKEEPDKSVARLFVQKGRPKIYTPEYRAYRWKTQYDPATQIETSYARDLKSIFYRIRQAQLHALMEGGWEEAIRHSKLEALLGEPLWDTYWRDIQGVSEKYLTQTVDMAGAEVKSLLGDIGIGIDSTWSIWDTRAKELLDWQINAGPIKGITGTMRADLGKKVGAAIEYGWTVDETADVIREEFNIAQNRTPTIVRTEMGNAINYSRVEGFEDVGITFHEWLSSQDALVRETHRLDGEIVQIGQTFSNGLRWPNDPNGPPEEVINCRCITLPVFEE